MIFHERKVEYYVEILAIPLTVVYKYFCFSISKTAKNRALRLSLAPKWAVSDVHLLTWHILTLFLQTARQGRHSETAPVAWTLHLEVKWPWQWVLGYFPTPVLVHWHSSVVRVKMSAPHQLMQCHKTWWELGEIPCIRRAFCSRPRCLQWLQCSAQRSKQKDITWNPHHLQNEKIFMVGNLNNWDSHSFPHVWLLAKSFFFFFLRQFQLPYLGSQKCSFGTRWL